MEFVYVVPRRDLFPGFYPQGFLPFGERLSLRSVEDACSHGFFVERARAEENPEWKQVIPYSIVSKDGEILLFRRLSNGGEARLHNRLSIGIGGHIDPVDLEGAVTRLRQGPAGLIEAGSIREIHEELVVECELAPVRVGILNDDSNPVGAVHVGIVQLVPVTGDVSIRETETLQGSFVPPAELRRRLSEGASFESWSAALIEHLAELLPTPPAPQPEPPASTLVQPVRPKLERSLPR
jgi:predicted NUDIX family phosphoesterase